jgi:hypothetical protein
VKRSRYAILLAAALVPFGLALAGCPEKEESAPANTAKPEPTPAPSPTPSATLAPAEPPDAGADGDAGDASDDADAAKKVGSNIGACCAAIKANRASAPPAQWPMYDLAIGACQSGQIPAQFRNLAQCK